ncbi:hypothetical protein Hanom_Chr14g01311471 [Helianthus anomalus]
MEDNYLLVFDRTRRIMMQVFRPENRLYKIKLKVGLSISLLAKLDDPAWLWHAQLGHLNFDS